MKILMVDDNQSKVFLFKQYLTDLDEVTVCDNYTDGIKKIKSEQYDLLVLDMHFPIIQFDTIEHKAGMYFLRELELDNIQIPTVIYTSDEFDMFIYSNIISYIHYHPEVSLKEEITRIKKKINLDIEKSI